MCIGTLHSWNNHVSYYCGEKYEIIGNKTKYSKCYYFLYYVVKNVRVSYWSRGAYVIIKTILLIFYCPLY